MRKSLDRWVPLYFITVLFTTCPAFAAAVEVDGRIAPGEYDGATHVTDFRFVQPLQGTTYVMRGVVELQWREAAQTARKARKAGKARRTRHARARRQHAARGRRFLLSERRSGVVRERTLLTETGMKGVVVVK